MRFATRTKLCFARAVAGVSSSRSTTWKKGATVAQFGPKGADANRMKGRDWPILILPDGMILERSTDSDKDHAQVQSLSCEIAPGDGR
jgi:hypothetical protein